MAAQGQENGQNRRYRPCNNNEGSRIELKSHKRLRGVRPAGQFVTIVVAVNETFSELFRLYL